MDQENIDKKVKSLMFDLMLVLHNHGITEISIGALMRLIGVDFERAARHDSEFVEITNEFAKYVLESRSTRRPENETLH